MARGELDRTDLALIERMRARGASWAACAQAVGCSVDRARRVADPGYRSPYPARAPGVIAAGGGPPPFPAPDRWRLDARETRMLSVLMARDIVRFDELSRAISGCSTMDPKQVRTYLSRLRTSLAPVGGLIQSVRGQGYAMPAASKALLRAEAARG